jgi:dihydrofolate reductase
LIPITPPTNTNPIKLAFIVAVAENGVIGANGTLPWRLSSDLKTFRRLTMGKPMIMGRRTFQSLVKPLDGRDNLVVTRDISFSAAGTEVFTTLDTALARARALAATRGVDEIMVIGGAEIFAQLAPTADRMYWTQVHASPPGDTLFPLFDRAAWREVGREGIPRGPKDDFDATLLTFERVKV